MTDKPAPGNQLDSTAEGADTDVDDLRSGLADLANLVADSLGLEELLARVATYAVQAIPAADGAGLTLLRSDRTDNRVKVLAASAPFVQQIDEIQYVEVNEGPCITAALERRTVRSGSLGGEKLWPRFGPRVGRLGVHSVLSLPLLLPGQVVGAINVYAHRKDAFTERAAELGELFAVPAAVAVHNAHVLTQARALTTQLQTALSTRPVIDQAIGILRARSGGTAEDAFDRLRRISQAENVKLAVVARSIVDEAVRRAHARRTAP
ncbi:GAF and ANTAR domain-containing protein [Mycobacterium sp. UM_WGJ]|uniref:GAF and ANTAR domain-containing protein n=1 Tax=Mycobacterium sp. UM_WGJ TaxID=1370120 RepID=UPI0004252B34|nr:GAF and ANTAR domain-containing protein [Mycobacterium sp. UM_WGJ]